VTQFLKEFKLAMLFKPFALVYLKSYRSLLRDVFEQPAEIQYEYVMLLIKLLYQLTATQKAAILEELALYDRQIEANDKLREVLSKVDL
jgi:hypothetical protein